MAQDQIRQMVNFILQEAHEKANEIRVKTEHDFNLEKQTLVHEAKLNIQDEFLQQEKNHEIQQRIARSTEIGASRVKKMEIRDKLLNELIAEAGSKCAIVSKGSNYSLLIEKLIVQGMIKLDEDDVTIYCRSSDVNLVKEVLPKAVTEYVEIMKKETNGIELKPKIAVNENRDADLSDDSFGGVILTALGGKIVCDNTMKARLELVYDELLPSIRALVFPEED